MLTLNSYSKIADIIKYLIVGIVGPSFTLNLPIFRPY